MGTLGKRFGWGVWGVSWGVGLGGWVWGVGLGGGFGGWVGDVESFPKTDTFLDGNNRPSNA